jgi:hypothetical protein
LSAAVAIYLLCLTASLACALLLGRAYRRARTPLLLWTSISFGFFALNNLLLAADMLVFTQVDLLPLRQAATGLGLAALLYGFVWQTR